MSTHQTTCFRQEQENRERPLIFFSCEILSGIKGLFPVIKGENPLIINSALAKTHQQTAWQ